MFYLHHLSVSPNGNHRIFSVVSRFFGTHLNLLSPPSGFHFPSQQKIPNLQSNLGGPSASKSEPKALFSIDTGGGSSTWKTFRCICTGSHISSTATPPPAAPPPIAICVCFPSCAEFFPHVSRGFRIGLRTTVGACFCLLTPHIFPNLYSISCCFMFMCCVYRSEGRHHDPCLVRSFFCA